MTPADLLDDATLQNLVDLDDGGYGLVSEMLEIFRDDTPRRIQDILAAVAQGSTEGLSQAGHALKGGAGALGARAMRTLAAELEALGRDGSVAVAPDLAARLEGLYQGTLSALEGYIEELKKK